MLGFKLIHVSKRDSIYRLVYARVCVVWLYDMYLLHENVYELTVIKLHQAITKSKYNAYIYWISHIDIGMLC